MKRLVMLFVAVMTATTFAQGKDLAGSWVLDTEKSGTKDGPPAMTITMTSKVFTVVMGEVGKSAPPLSFNLDGTESTLDRGAKGKVAWNGSKLTATILAGQTPSNLTFSREGAWLVLDGITPHGPMKVYFKKAPAK